MKHQKFCVCDACAAQARRDVEKILKWFTAGVIAMVLAVLILA